MTTALPNYHLLAKPAGAACNLGCKYCFFLSKENLNPPRESPLMDEATLETYIRQLMESPPGPQVDVARQGGELVCQVRESQVCLQRTLAERPLDPEDSRLKRKTAHDEGGH